MSCRMKHPPLARSFSPGLPSQALSFSPRRWFLVRRFRLKFSRPKDVVLLQCTAAAGVVVVRNATRQDRKPRSREPNSRYDSCRDVSLRTESKTLLPELSFPLLPLHSQKGERERERRSACRKQESSLGHCGPLLSDGSVLAMSDRLRSAPPSDWHAPPSVGEPSYLGQEAAALFPTWPRVFARTRLCTR